MDSKVIVVFKGSPMDSEIIKDILNDNGIIATLNNQLMGTIAPWQVSNGGFEPVEVEILEKDKDKALLLIEQFNESK